MSSLFNIKIKTTVPVNGWQSRKFEPVTEFNCTVTRYLVNRTSTIIMKVQIYQALAHFLGLWHLLVFELFRVHKGLISISLLPGFGVQVPGPISELNPAWFVLTGILLKKYQYFVWGSQDLDMYSLTQNLF